MVLKNLGATRLALSMRENAVGTGADPIALKGSYCPVPGPEVI